MTTQLFKKLPTVGAWRLNGAFEGHEVTRFAEDDQGVTIKGTTVGAEERAPWVIQYVINVDQSWHVRKAMLRNDAGTQRVIETDGAGSWIVDGTRYPELSGCLDLDIEASMVTNTIPVHRLALQVNQKGESAAVYIRLSDLKIERLDQTYQRLSDSEGKVLFDYHVPRFSYHGTLQFSSDGLTANYPGIGARVVL